jgi:hypothetical protein
VKTLRKLCAVTILSLTLVGSAFAGHMDTTGVVSQPQPPQSGASTSTSIVLTILSLIYR